MTSSGTISQTVFTVRKVIEHAFRRCRLPAQAITAEMVDIAVDQLYLMLSEWANKNIQLWCIDKLILPLYEGQGFLPLPLGTVDILNANIRQTTEQTTGTTTQTPNAITRDFGSSPVQITTLGITWSGTPVPFLVQISVDGLTWITLGTFNPVPNSGNRTWHDVDGSLAQRFFRVIAVGTATLPISGVYLGNNPLEITIARLNRDDFVNYPNKTFQGRPLQYWYDRQRDIQIMNLWPVPSTAYVNQQITVWRKRYIMDVTRDTSQTLDVPQRWYDAVVYNLAMRCAEEVPEVAVDVLGILIPRAQMSLMSAQAEERDSSPIYWSPNIGVYTR